VRPRAPKDSIVVGDSETYVCAPITAFRPLWTVAARSMPTEDVELRIELEEAPRDRETDRSGAGRIYIGADACVRGEKKPDHVLRIDGTWLRADVLERFARTLLAAVEAAKTSHPEHWRPTRGELTIELERRFIPHPL
jgi:hypothetical protein